MCYAGVWLITRNEALRLRQGIMGSIRKFKRLSSRLSKRAHDEVEFNTHGDGFQENDSQTHELNIVYYL